MSVCIRYGHTDVGVADSVKRVDSTHAGAKYIIQDERDPRALIGVNVMSYSARKERRKEGPNGTTTVNINESSKDQPCKDCKIKKKKGLLGRSRNDVPSKSGNIERPEAI